MNDDFYEMKRQHQERKHSNNKRYDDSSKKKLMENLKKKFTTTMIGAIHAFENDFGQFWGHDKADDELTEDEEQFREVWFRTRTQILDNGNNQLRAAMKELSQYTVKWNRYTTTFKARETYYAE